MDDAKKCEDADRMKRSLPPQVEKMMASAKEMEAILTAKLSKIDSVSLEKSEMAKQEALKIKADVEEIKRLSLIRTKEGDEALKAKIMEVNQRIETTTRKAAEIQKRMVEMYKELYEELAAKAVEVRKNIDDIQELPDSEKVRLKGSIDAMVSQSKDKWIEMQAMDEKLATLQKKAQECKIDPKTCNKEDILKKLETQLDSLLGPLAPPDEDKLDGPNTYKAEPRKKDK